jgi:hypothetical protein
VPIEKLQAKMQIFELSLFVISYFGYSFFCFQKKEEEKITKINVFVIFYYFASLCCEIELFG